MLTFYDEARHGDDRYVVLAEEESHTSACVEQKCAPAVLVQSAATVAEVQIYPAVVVQNALLELG